MAIDGCYSRVIDSEIPVDKKFGTDVILLSITQEKTTVDKLSHFNNKLIHSSGCKFTKQKCLVASHKAQE